MRPDFSKIAYKVEPGTARDDHASVWNTAEHIPVKALYTTEQIEALQAIGVQPFLHIQSDAIQTLTHWQDKLGTGGSR